MNWFRLKTCIKCQGDLVSDQQDWICIQCGTYYYTGLYQAPAQNEEGTPPPVETPPQTHQGKSAGGLPVALSHGQKTVSVSAMGSVASL